MPRMPFTSPTTRSRAIRNGPFLRTRFMVGHGLSETLNNLYMGNDFEAERRRRYLSDPVPRNRYRRKLFRRIAPRGGAWHAATGEAATAPMDRWCATTTSRPSTRTPYNIEIQDADSAMIEGNSELVGFDRSKKLLCQHGGSNPHLDFEERDLPEECVLLQRGSGNAFHGRWVLLLRPALGMANLKPQQRRFFPRPGRGWHFSNPPPAAILPRCGHSRRKYDR